MGKQYQDGLTIVTEIKEGAIGDLRIALSLIEADIEENPYIPFVTFDTLHFCRWIIFEEQYGKSNPRFPSTLVLSSNFDEPFEFHLKELYDKGINGLNLVYQHCKGYPAENERSPERVKDYMRRHNVGYNTLYVGTRGRTVIQIRREADLRTKIQLYLDKAICDPEFKDLGPEAVRGKIQQFVESQPELQWALEKTIFESSKWPRLRDLWPILLILLIAIFPIIIGSLTTGWIGAGLFFLMILFILGAALKLRTLEKNDEQYPAVTDYKHVRDLSVREDQIVQNQMSSITYVKAGWLRRTVLQIVLWAIDMAGRYIYTKGKLGSIPSIHYARWVMVDQGIRLIFFSNFDGSWENYLGDFIDKAASGLTAVWSNTRGFPRSRGLVNEGATDEQRFKAYARNSQVITNVWFSAYKRLSVQNINNNSHIRSGLFAALNQGQIKEWLRRF